MKELFTIGEMAELFQINIRTLRYYDDIGLLCPETVNPENRVPLLFHQAIRAAEYDQIPAHPEHASGKDEAVFARTGTPG